MIWQLIMSAMLAFGIIGAYGKHTDGDTREAAAFAMGVATVVGLLMIVTGFATVGRSGDVRRDAAAAPTYGGMPAPVQRSGPLVAPPPSQSAAPFTTAPLMPAPSTSVGGFAPVDASPPKPNLGPDGLAYDRVEAIMMRYRGLYAQAVNDIQRTDLRFARGQDLCQAQGGQYAVLARLGSVSTNKSGDASITFETTSGMELIPGATFERGNPIHDALASVSPGSPVAVLFRFQSDGTGKDCFHSHRWTEHNNMMKPQWDIELISISTLR